MRATNFLRIAACKRFSSTVSPFNLFHDAIDDPSGKWKQKTMTLEQKAAIINAVESGAKRSCVANTKDSFVVLFKFNHIHGCVAIAQATNSSSILGILKVVHLIGHIFQ